MRTETVTVKSLLAALKKGQPWRRNSMAQNGTYCAVGRMARNILGTTDENSISTYGWAIADAISDQFGINLVGINDSSFTEKQAISSIKEALTPHTDEEVLLRVYE